MVPLPRAIIMRALATLTRWVQYASGDDLPIPFGEHGFLRLSEREGMRDIGHQLSGFDPGHEVSFALIAKGGVVLR